MTPTIVSAPISDAQLAANRANALISTGHRSSEGKQTVARNATRHNLSSASPVLAGEDKLDFERFLFECKIDLAPHTHTEHALVEQIAFAEWKLLRASQWETRIIDAILAGGAAPCMALFGKTPDEALARLHRYESGIRRAWHNALRELCQVKKSNRDAATSGERADYIHNLKEKMEKVVTLADARTNPIPPSDDFTPPSCPSDARAA